MVNTTVNKHPNNTLNHQGTWLRQKTAGGRKKLD